MVQINIMTIKFPWEFLNLKENYWNIIDTFYQNTQLESCYKKQKIWDKILRQKQKVSLKNSLRLDER